MPCPVVVPLSISFLFFFFKFPIAYFNYFRLLRVLHGCFCLISVFIFSFAFPFSNALSLSRLSIFLLTLSIPCYPCHSARWTSVLQFICYGIEFHLAVFFYISDGAQRGVCATYLPCVIDNGSREENNMKLNASKCKIAQNHKRVAKSNNCW